MSNSNGNKYADMLTALNSEHALESREAYETMTEKQRALMNIALDQIKELEYYRQMLNVITECATEGIQIADAEGNLLYNNEAVFRITGVDRQERAGRNIFDVQSDGALSTALKTKKPVLAHINSSRPGLTSVSNATPIYNDNGEIIGAVSVFNDVANVNRLFQAIKDSQPIVTSMQDRGEYKLNRSFYNFQDLIGNSEAMTACVNLGKKIALTDKTLLITGESGTGKELIAHSIHNMSARSGKAFIKVNCPAIPAAMLESELFGYSKGAFTGAIKDKPGKFELANGGTIFLDEIGDLEFSLQSKLLRVLQENEIERLGSNEIKKIDVRIIAATNQDLLECVNKGLFRKDLYYRLDVYRLLMPSLRERKSDIPLIVEYILKKYSISYPRKWISKEAITELMNYDWPGNVRELENVISKLILYQNGEVIGDKDVQFVLNHKSAAAAEADETQTIAELERIAITKAMNKYGTSLNSKKLIAEKLGISLSRLYNRIHQYKLQDF